MKFHAQHHAALVLPQAWVVLETSLCGLARGITALLKWCGQPGPADGSKPAAIPYGNRGNFNCGAQHLRHLNHGVVTSWLLDHDCLKLKERHAGLLPSSTLLVTVLRREQTLRLAAVRRTSQ